MPNKKPKIFISHASEDVDYVAKIVNLLDGMGLNQTQMFCSSLPGYGIPIDTDICESLWNQFNQFDLHVIFVHSDNYYQSAYSLNEMGAAWALKTVTTSILLPGFEFEEMTGVVNNRINSIKLDRQLLEVQDKLNQLYDKIVEEFGLTKKSDIIWQQKRDSFINEIMQIENSKCKRMLSEGAEALLLAATDNANGQVTKMYDMAIAGDIITGGITEMPGQETQRGCARWATVVDELVKIGFISQTDEKGKKFQVTDAGYKYLDK